MSAKLEALLDRTLEALVFGDLSQLADLAPKVEAAVQALPRLDHISASRLRLKADRNAMLLLSAQRGIKAAGQRLADIGKARVLSTYDAKGRLEVMAAPSGQALLRV